MKPTARSMITLMIFAAATTLCLAVGPAQAQQEPGMVGSKACADCHDEMVAGFATSTHARAFAASGRFTAAGCESCHGAGGAHVQEQTRATIVSFASGSGRGPDQLSAQCLGCHAESAAVGLWDVGAHRKNDITCTSCHSVHGPGGLTPRQPDLCFGCHRNVKFEVAKRSHHPIAEGKVTCSGCHDPHGTLAPRMLKADTVNELCYDCHADKRGPFIWEHTPVTEDCTICHTPHGSRQRSLLVRKLPNLCQECHDWTRHPGTAYDAKTGFTGTSPSNRSFGRSCMNCHSSIHGSWAPVDPNNGENAGNKWMR